MGNTRENLDVSELNKRLTEIEQKLSALNLQSEQDHQPIHSSRHKFDVIEAIVDSVIENSNEKTCAFEPNGKPCDHCDMCSTRGF